MIGPEQAEFFMRISSFMSREVTVLMPREMTLLPVLYLDAGTGSLLFQWIIAGLVGASFAIKMSWRRISDWRHGKGDEDSTDV